MRIFTITYIFIVLIICKAQSQETFDAELDSTRRWNWALDNSGWDFSGRGLLLRDDNGNVIQTISSFPEGDQWINSGLNTYEYNSSNQLINYLVSFLIDTTWVAWSRQSYMYDAFGNTVQTLWQHLNNNAWENSVLVTNTFDDDQKILTSIVARWDTTEWVEKEWNEFIYSQEGLLLFKNIREHVVGGIFRDYRFEYTYDSEGRLTRVAFQNPLGGGLWDDLSYELYTYGDSTVTITEKRYSQGGFINYRRHISIYNNEEKLVSEVSANWDDGWENNDSIRYYYSEQISSFRNVSENVISIYPNPCRSDIHFIMDNDQQGGVVKIFSLNGTLVKTVNLKEKITMPIDINNLPAGLYQLIMNSTQGIFSGRFVKQ